MMNKAAEYRLHARECLALASSATDQGERNELLKMARTWEALASEQEKRQDEGDPSPAPDERITRKART